MYNLIQELLSCRAPYPSYPMFLYEKMALFKIRALKEGRPYKVFSTPKLLETFIKSDFLDQNLLCDFFLHERACPIDIHSNPVPYLGDIQLRSFTSFVTNHIHWWSSIHTIQKNEDTSTLWVQSDPQYHH